MALRDFILGPLNLILPQLRDLCDAIEALISGGAGVGVDVSSFATGGDGTQGDPWTGWDTAITWTAHTTYSFRSGYFAYATSPNFLKTDIALIGEAGTFLQHTGTGDAFTLASDDLAVTWYHRVRVENITILGHVTTLSGSASASSGTNTIVGTGTSFLSQVAVGDAIAFESGSSNNETRLVTAVTDDTHITVSGNWLTSKSGAGMKCGKTRHGVYMGGCRNVSLKNVTVHDVANSALYAEWCVTNQAELLVSSYHDPIQSTEFQVRSQYGIKLDHNTTTFTFIEPVIEGTQAAGIYTLDGSYGNTFINGTSEGNKGKGAVFASVSNTIINTDFEANEGLDVEVLQSRNRFINTVIEGSITIGAGAGNRIEGGVCGAIVADGDYAIIDGVEVLGTITGAALSTLINFPYVNTPDGNFRPDVRVGNVIDWVKDLTPGSTVSTDARIGRINYFNSSTNFTLANPTNPANGQAVTWRITQTASHTITFGSKFRIAPGKDFPRMPATGEVLYVTARYHSTDDRWDIEFSNNDIFSSLEASDISAQDINATGAFYVDDMQVLTNQQAAIADPTGGATVDTQCRAALVSLLDANRAHGLIGITPPFSLANTIFYSEAQFLTYNNGANVKKWRERSGNGRHLAQSDPTKQPLFITGAIDGHPCVRFDGSNDYLISGAWSYNQPFCISLVLKRYNNTFKYIYSSIDNFGAAMFQADGASNDLVTMYAGSGSGDPSGAIDSGVWYLVTAEYNTTSSKIYENGTQVGSTGNPGSQNGNGFLLGNRYDLSLPSQIDVAAVVIYLTTERSNVETYLLAEYPSL